MTTRDLLKEGDRWGGHEVLAVTDPTGTLSLDDPLMLEVHPHKGVTVLSHGARGEQLLSWPFSAVATVEGALQSEDPDDMQLSNRRFAREQLLGEHTAHPHGIERCLQSVTQAGRPVELKHLCVAIGEAAL